MITEAAMALVQDVPKTQGGGVMTSAPAAGEALIARLQARAGLVFSVVS